MTYEEIKNQAAQAVTELLEAAKLSKGDIFVIGCSSSEIKGARIGKGSDIDAAKAVYEGVYPILAEKGIYIDIIPMEKVPSLKWKEKIDYWYGHCLRAWHNYTNSTDKLMSALFFPFAWGMLQLTRFVNTFCRSNQIAHAYGWKAYGGFSKQDVFPVIDMRFEDIQVMVPKNSDAVLTALFGDYMQIPPKEKRPQHARKIEIYK